MADKHANSTSIIAKPTAGITPEEVRDTRARALAFVIDCYEKKKAASESRLDDAKGPKHDRATADYTRT